MISCILFTMIVIDGKKILMLVMGIFCFSAILCTNVSNVGETVLTSSTPTSNKVIVLDAGHGKPDEGAEGENGITEEKTNLDITLKVQKLLEESGATVILTRSDENGIYDIDKNTLREMKVSDIKNRVKIGNESSADICVSIHLNKGDNSQYTGWQTFYKKSDDSGKRLAVDIQEELKNSIQEENKRTAHEISNIYLVDHVEIPITIVECGFLSNPQEANKLLTDEYQNKVAWGIFSGIQLYFNEV